MSVSNAAPPRRPRVTLVVTLAVFWILLWGNLSWANAISGVFVAAATAVAMTGPWRGERFALRPLATARLVGWVAVKLVHASYLVARQVIAAPGDSHQGVVEFDMSARPSHAVALVANIISFVPGTLTVDYASEPTRLTVHVLDLRDRDAVMSELNHLDTLVCRAFGILGDTGSEGSAPSQGKAGQS